MRFAFLPAFLFVFVTAVSTTLPTLAQDAFQAKDLVGGWEIDYPKTKKYWTSKTLKKHVGVLPMMQLAAPQLQFTKDKFTFGVAEGSYGYRVNSFDQETKILTVFVIEDERTSSIEFLVEDKDTLVANMPFSVMGPIQLAYSRKGKLAKVDAKDDPFTPYNGEWKLNVDLTKELWERWTDDITLKNYEVYGQNAIEDAMSITISRGEVEYSDKSFSAGEVVQASSNKISMRANSSYQPNLQLQRISESVILLADIERNLLAVYQRPERVKPDPAKWKAVRSSIGKQVLDRFKPSQKRRPRLDVVGPLGQSGALELAGLEIERRIVSTAVKHADITNLSLSFYLETPSRHYGHENRYLCRVLELNDIKDDKGKLLLTANRRKRIDALTSPARLREFQNRPNGSTGPMFEIVLEAPQLTAQKIPKIAGEMVLLEYQSKTIRFKDIGSLQGKPLSHSLLGKTKLRVAIENGQFPEVKLAIADADRHQVVRWHVSDADGIRLPSNSVGSGPGEETQGYRDRVPKNAILVMEIVDVFRTHSYPFEFKDIGFE